MRERSQGIDFRAVDKAPPRSCRKQRILSESPSPSAREQFSKVRTTSINVAWSSPSNEIIFKKSNKVVLPSLTFASIFADCSSLISVALFQSGRFPSMMVYSRSTSTAKASMTFSLLTTPSSLNTSWLTRSSSDAVPTNVRRSWKRSRLIPVS